jgi:hypothetical protein
MSYESPTVEVVGSLHDLTQTTKFVSSSSDGYYLGVKGSPGSTPLNS